MCLRWLLMLLLLLLWLHLRLRLNLGLWLRRLWLLSPRLRLRVGL